MVSLLWHLIPPRQAEGSLPTRCLALAMKSPDLNGRQDALGIIWYPSLIPGVGGQNMHMCKMSSRGDQILAKWPGGLSVLFELFFGDKGWSAGFYHFWNISWMCPACSVEVTSPWSFEKMSLILKKVHILEQNSCPPKRRDLIPKQFTDGKSEGKRRDFR